jgi:uracil-DNA glycosylase
MIRSTLAKAFDYRESLARAIYESSALYFGKTLLSRKNGDAPCKILFVSDVPEVHAGAVTGIPFVDPAMLAGPAITAEDETPAESSVTARRFWQFAKPLGIKKPDAKNGWQGSKCFVAYLLARHPSTAERGHRAPTGTEIKIALQLLKAQLELTQPRIIVPLGDAPSKAVEKLLRLQGTPQVSRTVETQANWGPVTILSLTHPRPKERLKRADWQQKLDWRKLARLKKTRR